MLNLKHTTERIFPGLVIAGLVAVTAQFLSEHYGAPAMLMAILLGISLQFLSEETRTEPGVAFAAKGLLRFGVALLGARISIEMLQALGPALVALIIIAVIFYPILADILGLNLRQSGVFLGGTIHDVAQVVGAGYSISEETGDLATVVKLIRVTMLAPVVLIASMFLRKYAEPGEARPPLLPGFVLAFLIIAALNSFHVLPEVVRDLASVVSRWALLTAIAAVGMKTSIPRILQVGGPAIGLLVVQSIFLAGFVLVGAFMLG